VEGHCFWGRRATAGFRWTGSSEREFGGGDRSDRSCPTFRPQVSVASGTADGPVTVDQGLTADV